MQVKTLKCKEQIRRVDVLAEEFAIRDLLHSVQKAKSSIQVRGLIDNGLDLNALRQNQQQIRKAIDNEDS